MPTVVLDACVLYPAPLRDLLMRLAVNDLFRARWTDRIHDEWIAAVLRQRPDLTRQQLERTRFLMDENVRDGLVAGFEPLIATLRLPDPEDRHVLAAAIVCGGEIILTFNIKHFPVAALAPHGIQAVHPDDFVQQLLATAPNRVCEAVRRQRLGLKKPPKAADEMLDTLAKQIPKSVGVLRQHVPML